MKSSIAALALLLAMMNFVWPTEGWLGTYSGSKGTGSSSMTAEIKGEKNDWWLQGQAVFDGQADRPRPEFWGEFRGEKDGTLLFELGDTLGNKGTVEARKVGQNLRLSFKVDQVGDPRCAAHYFDRTLEPWHQPGWVPKGYDLGDKWTSPDGKFDVYDLSGKRDMMIGVRQRASEGTLLLKKPSQETVGEVLKREFGMAPSVVQRARVISLEWTKDDAYTIVFGISLSTNDPRFYQKELELKQSFRCESGPRVTKIGEAEGRIIPGLGYGHTGESQ